MRRCVRCNNLLNVYNKSDECLAHGVQREIEVEEHIDKYLKKRLEYKEFRINPITLKLGKI